MKRLCIVCAGKRDRKKLISYFKHYKNKELIEQRVCCYTSYNHTVIAKDKNKIVGVLQWCLKEDPNDGNIEFEEIHVLEEYRGKGIATKILKFAIKQVRDYLKKFDIKPRQIFLFVSKENKPARALYEKCGFKCIANVGHLLADKDELLYSMEL